MLNQNQKSNNVFQSSKKKPVRRAQNFVEALKSIGGSTVKSVQKDLVQGTGRDMINSVTGGANPDLPPRFPGTQPSNEWGSQPHAPGRNPEWLKQREDAIRAQERGRKRHQEIVSAKPLFDRRQEEVKAQIKALQDELKALAQDIKSLGVGTQKAIEEEVVNPGSYHISFFEKLRNFVVALRKQVKESGNWLELSAQRKQAKNVYWGNVKKSGTKYMMSQERTLATQTG